LPEFQAVTESAIHLGNVSPAPVNRQRLARYLELQSVAQLDPITDAEIHKLDARRDELLSPWQRAVVAPIAHLDGRWIELDAPVSSIEATDAYSDQLRDSGADRLVVAAFTIGGRVDQIIKDHLGRDEIYEAFVLKQWAATMTEQARVDLTRRLRGWAENNRHALLPYDGPGYNGWPLCALHPLLKTLYAGQEPQACRPIRATDSGVLLPTNSMLIVFALSAQRHIASVRAEEPLAQCHRCAMRNCRFRITATADVACSR
jgi:hypothetical protein